MLSKVCKLSCILSLYTSHCFQIDLVLSYEELLESLGVRCRFVRKLKTHYPNVPATLLPLWCKSGTSDHDLVYPDRDDEQSKLSKVRKKMAKWYSKLLFTDDYSTSGVKIYDAIKQPPVGTSVVMLSSKLAELVHGTECPNMDAFL